MPSIRVELERAWARRAQIADREALRVFHGRGEGSGPLRSWAIDRFGEHAWITRWEDAGSAGDDSAVLREMEIFLRARGLRSAVWLGRPEQGVPAVPRVLFGEPPAGRFEVREGRARFLIQLLETRHPGLFLDHEPLRKWLAEAARGWRVLNTFAYTGSLSVAAGLGGAAHVTTLDLSRPTVEWAEANWRCNGLADADARFIYGDVFEWLPRLGKDGSKYDCVILDPPSFSRGKKGTFSTGKDLKRLHELALEILADGGKLITSINSANVGWDKYERDVADAARAQGFELRELRRIELPEETFPGDDYLKGWVLEAGKR